MLSIIGSLNVSWPAGSDYMYNYTLTSCCFMMMISGIFVAAMAFTVMRESPELAEWPEDWALCLSAGAGMLIALVAPWGFRFEMNVHFLSAFLLLFVLVSFLLAFTSFFNYLKAFPDHSKTAVHSDPLFYSAYVGMASQVFTVGRGLYVNCVGRYKTIRL